MRNASIVNASPGRLRIELPELYRSSIEKLKIEKEFFACRSVVAVYANPLTARILVLFDPAFSLDRIFKELGLSPVKAGRSRHNPWQDRARGRSLTHSRQVVAPAAGYRPWHLLEASAAIEFFGTSSERGLSKNVVAQRLRHGSNVLSPQKSIASIALFLNQFANLPTLLLGISAVLSVLTGGVVEAFTIAFVLAMNGVIGFVTERRAESTIAALSELIDDSVPVLRDGKIQGVEASRIVVGDLLILSSGTRIAADARLISAQGLTIDESALTGESMPVAKNPMLIKQSVALAERSNMVYRGCAVSLGSGRAVVVGTGSQTEIGAIQTLMAHIVRPKTPIQTQLDQLGNQLVKISSAICLGIFGLGLLRGYRWLPMFKHVISLAIAAVPEGLPTVATTSLARGVKQMREKNVLIRHLQAVETIGAMETICLDKTGTLTMNRMSAVAVRTNRHKMAARDGALQGFGATLFNQPDVEMTRLLQVCVLCNQLVWKETVHDDLQNGSATENALIDLATQAGFSAREMRRRYALLAIELRAEGRNYMRTVHTIPDSPHYLIAVKGTPTEVLALCQHYQAGENLIALTPSMRANIALQNQAMAQRQLRVLGFAYAEIAVTAMDTIEKKALVWVGLVGLADPLRSGVENVIASFHQAGIRTVMLTGDQAATAYAIGKSLSLNHGDELHIVNSEPMDGLESEVLGALAERADIFARVSPSHKLRIVQALQRNGRTVAMTGDGINDGPALQAADIGIAMGSGGTDLARSAADVVLKYDRLETVLEAISQGRTISSNIRKSLHFLISSNLSEILVVLGSILIGTGQPLTPLQLLWLNLLSDVLPAIAFAAEPPEADVMAQAPRSKAKPIVEKVELWRYAREGSYLAGGALSAYWYGLLRHGAGSRAGTIAFNSLVLGQLLHAFSCRSERHSLFFQKLAPNRQLNAALGMSLALQLSANLIPGLRRYLNIAPMNMSDSLAMIAGAGIPLVLNEALKSR